MKKLLNLITLHCLLIISLNCSSDPNNKNIVLITTKFGEIKILLYNETPLHRDNFKKLVSEEYFNNQIFHRVIKDFMIQGGDPNSINAEKGAILGNGGPGYTIPAEFNTKFFHKKGALAAARKSDNENPEKNSSGSQFYIVQGKIFTDDELNYLENHRNQSIFKNLLNKYFIKEQEKAISNNENLNYPNIIDIAKKQAQEEYNKLKLYKFTDIQRNAYKIIGGAPHLDGNYTVFGEVIEGLEIIDKIASIETNKQDRPVEDIKIIMKILK